MIERQYQLDLWRTLSFFLLLPSATSSSVLLWEEKEGDKILSCHVRSILDGRPPRRAEKNWRLSLSRSFGEGEKRAGRCRNSNYSTINPISIKDRAKSIVHSFAAFYPSLKGETRQKNKKKEKRNCLTHRWSWPSPLFYSVPEEERYCGHVIGAAVIKHLWALDFCFWKKKESTLFFSPSTSSDVIPRFNQRHIDRLKLATVRNSSSNNDSESRVCLRKLCLSEKKNGMINEKKAKLLT